MNKDLVFVMIMLCLTLLIIAGAAMFVDIENTRLLVEARCER